LGNFHFPNALEFYLTILPLLGHEKKELPWWRNYRGMIKEEIVIGPMGSLQSRFEADQNHWASSNLHDFFQRLLL
jgi:hypothetical protein